MNAILKARGGLVLLVMGFSCQACGANAEDGIASTGVHSPTELTATAATLVPALANGGVWVESGDQWVVPTSDFTASGDPVAQSSINLPPLFITGSRASLSIDYEEDPSGGFLAIVRYYAQDAEDATRLELASYLDLGRTIALDVTSWGITLRIEGVAHEATAGSMQLMLGEGELRYEFTDLVFEGLAERVTSGSVSGVPIEYCSPLVTSSGPATPSGEIQVHEVDPTWSSAFCSKIPRLFP